MRIKNLFIFASVKIKVYILVAILAAALSYSLDCCVHQMRDITAVSGTADCGSLTDANSAPDKYVEFNCAFCALGSANIVAQRTNSSSGIPRNINIGKRCPETDNPFITIKSGKVSGLCAVNSFLSEISLHPSGLFSESHMFIHYCRLTI